MPCLNQNIREDLDDCEKQKQQLENMLCGVLTRVDQANASALFINPDLSLAAWWAAHKQKDAIRRVREAANQRQTALLRSASGKLTPEEREALGIR